MLILNANFEPVHVCNMRRALSLMISGKASLVLNGRGLVHTVSRDFPRPSILRLEKMVRRPRPTVRLTKREILRRDNYTCQYCNSNGNHLTIDHVFPRHAGGEHSWENLVTACPACNHRKGSRTVEQAGMRLHHQPEKPPASALYFFARHLSENREWEPFINGW